MTGKCKCGCGAATKVTAGKPRDYLPGHHSLTELPAWTPLYVAAFDGHLQGSPGARRLMRDLLTENAPQTAAVDYF